MKFFRDPKFLPSYDFAIVKSWLPSTHGREILSWGISGWLTSDLKVVSITSDLISLVRTLSHGFRFQPNPRKSGKYRV